MTEGPRLRARTSLELWRMREPFEIAGQAMSELPLLLLELTHPDGTVGRAEAAGIDYDGETPATMAAQIAAIAGQLGADTRPADVADWLPRGGARNALDCALWDLQARRSGSAAWVAAGLQPPQPLLTACTIGLGTLAETRRRAAELSSLPLIKLKLDAHRHLEPVRVVRQAAPQARLIVDANQAWTLAQLQALLPALAAMGVELVEQPLPRGAEAQLEGLNPVIPLAADESCTDRGSLAGLRGRYQVVNIKLDKCGGLSEALALAREARAMGFELMVGNMCGTSLGMAPAFLVAQQARWVDLDGPLLQTDDRPAAMRYDRGAVHPPDPALWG